MDPAKQLRKLADELEQMTLFPETQIQPGWYFFPWTFDLIKQDATPGEIFNKAGTQIAFEIYESREKGKPLTFEDAGIMIRIGEDDEVDPPEYYIAKDDGYDLGAIRSLVEQEGGVPSDYLIDDATKRIINDWLRKYDSPRYVG